MKKILSVLCVTFFSFGAFAQNAKYKEFFNAAKSYEQKKQYVYAMGSYLDAISVDPLNSLEAVENYLKLEEVIKSGKPGYGEFSVFELQSGWKDLLIDAEKYWTENFPYEISFGKWEVIDHDYATKTANYRKKIKIK